MFPPLLSLPAKHLFKHKPQPQKSKLQNLGSKSNHSVIKDNLIPQLVRKPGLQIIEAPTLGLADIGEDMLEFRDGVFVGYAFEVLGGGEVGEGQLCPGRAHQVKQKEWGVGG